MAADRTGRNFLCSLLLPNSLTAPAVTLLGHEVAVTAILCKSNPTATNLTERFASQHFAATSLLLSFPAVTAFLSHQLQFCLEHDELHADLRLRFRRVATPLLVNILKVRIFTGMSTMPPSKLGQNVPSRVP